MRAYRYPLDPIVTSLLIVFALITFAIYGGLIVRDDAVTAANSGDSPRDRAIRAERDASGALPGRFVPTQGRSHTDAWPLDAGERVPFCEDGEIDDDCYASNPPTSGLHLPVSRSIAINGEIINLPPDPGVYEVQIPREAIPHLQEHAGVFIGYDCDTQRCNDAVEQLRAVVEGQLRSGARVIMAPNSDLDDDTIALASWTRVDVIPAAAYEDARARAFIEAHSCRFDPEGFCEPPPGQRT